MSTATLSIFLAAVFMFAALITGAVRRYSLKHAVLDIPNQRSSHTVPTPRGGGLSISLSLLIAAALLFYQELLPDNYFVAYAGGCVVVAVTGWLDDHHDISAVWRMVFYTVACVWALYWLGILPAITPGEQAVTAGRWFGWILAMVAMIWLLNLYNFMDGTDGIAAVQAICAGLMSGMLLFSSGQPGLAVLCWTLAAGSAGFIVWNWPPARIFMGDTGSCVIGFSFAVLALADSTGRISLWIILLALFITDATLTLLLRMARREKWYSAHRSHAYQRVVQMGATHRQLAVAVILINIVLLWPAASMAAARPPLAPGILAGVIMLCSFLWMAIQLRYNRRSRI